LGLRAGAAAAFETSGGIMEAVLRTAGETIAGRLPDEIDLKTVRVGEGFRKASASAGGLTIKAGTVFGLSNAASILDQVRAGESDLRFIEFLCCPAGCVSGGGQPKVLLPADREKAYNFRKDVVRRPESESVPTPRGSHENPQISEIYSTFLEKPFSRRSRELLHVQYADNAPTAVPR
jgi:iron only hydrogenase large subunit-like protein